MKTPRPQLLALFVLCLCMPVGQTFARSIEDLPRDGKIFFLLNHSPATTAQLRRLDRLANRNRRLERIRLRAERRTHVASAQSQTESPPIQTPVPSTPTESLQEHMLEIINKEREKVQLSPLVLDEVLTGAAKKYAQEMDTRKFFAHIDPDGSTPLSRIQETEYLSPPCQCSWRYWIGENIAVGQTTVEEVMDDWMNSPDHRENILDPDFGEVGIGKEGNYWVQEFGNVTHE